MTTIQKWILLSFFSLTCIPFDVRCSNVVLRNIWFTTRITPADMAVKICREILNRAFMFAQLIVIIEFFFRIASVFVPLTAAVFSAKKLFLQFVFCPNDPIGQNLWTPFIQALVALVRAVLLWQLIQLQLLRYLGFSFANSLCRTLSILQFHDSY